MCESLETTSEVTDDQKEMNNFFHKNELVESRCLAIAQAALLCSVKLYNWVNKRAPHTISTPCVLHRSALASSALPEYLKTVLKHETESVNFITERACVFKVLFKDELIDCQC